MRRLGWCLLALVSACGSKSTDYTVGGGGGGGGSGGGKPDASVDGTVSGGDANVYTGRVCLVDDARLLTSSASCSPTGAGGLTVRLGNDTTTVLTNADGTFSIAGDPGSLAVWSVTGTAIVSSFEPLGNYLVPALSMTGYTSWLTSNGVTLLPGEGSVVALELMNGAGVASATATSTPTSRFDGFYSGASTTVWTQGTEGTDTHGVAWLAGIDAGTASIASQIPNGMTSTTVTTDGVDVFDGGVTFIQVVFP